MKSLINLWNHIFVYHNISSIKKTKVYYTRSKVRALKNIILNPHIVNAILDDEIVRVRDGVPRDAAKILIEQFGLHVLRHIIYNPSILWPFNNEIKGTTQVVLHSQSLINIPKVVMQYLSLIATL